jgi:uncharacterized protein (DUF433 family)
MKLPDFLIEVPYGEIRLTGHRIGLYHVVDLYNDSYSPEMLHEEFPTLPVGLINKVIAFYLENKAEVDAYMAECLAEMERRRAANPPRLDWDEMRRRFEEQRGAEQK